MGAGQLQGRGEESLTIENLHLRHHQPNDPVLEDSHISHIAGRLLLACGLRRGGAGRVVHMVAAQHGHHAHRQVGSHHAPCAGAKRTQRGLHVKEGHTATRSVRCGLRTERPASPATAGCAQRVAASSASSSASAGDGCSKRLCIALVVEWS